MVKPILLAAAAAACFSAQDVRDAECRAYCRVSGYDTGWNQKDLCWCGDAKPFEKTQEKRLTLPRRQAKGGKPAAAADPYPILPAWLRYSSD